MNTNDLLKSLYPISVRRDVCLKDYCRYKTGGNAAAMVFPKTADELKRAVTALKGVAPYFVLGGGSNVLISDKGFSGAVISTLKLDKIELKGNLCVAGAGAKISDVIRAAAINSLSGLEFAVGIPATVGGAVAMNAGCYNKSVSDAVLYVVTENGVYKKGECGFNYRASRFLGKETILEVCFNFSPAEFDDIEEKIKAYKSFRKNPKGRSCGSVFKNDGFFAGKVIDEAGLKGKRIGGAKVSDEHANFIIADSGATSKNIYDLIKFVKKKVLEEKNLTLSEELVYLGEFE